MMKKVYIDELAIMAIEHDSDLLKAHDAQLVQRADRMYAMEKMPPIPTLSRQNSGEQRWTELWGVLVFPWSVAAL